MWHGYRPTAQLFPQPQSWKGHDVCVFCSHSGLHFCEILLPSSTRELLRGGSSSPTCRASPGLPCLQHQRVDEHWSGCFTELDCIHPTAHFPNRNSSSLSHSGMAPRLQSSLLLFSKPSLAPLDPSRDAGATQGLCGR